MPRTRRTTSTIKSSNQRRVPGIAATVYFEPPWTLLITGQAFRPPAPRKTFNDLPGSWQRRSNLDPIELHRRNFRIGVRPLKRHGWRGGDEQRVPINQICGSDDRVVRPGIA